MATTTTPSTTEAAPKKLVAVLDLKASAGAEASATALSALIAAEVGAVDGHKAIARNELKSILAHSADAQLAGCNEARCAQEVVHLVNADLLVAGSVDKVGGATVVALSLISAGADGTSDGSQVVSRQEAAFRGKDEDALALARPLVQRLFAGPNAGTHTGSVEVFSVDDGVEVAVDGKVVGKTPLPPLRDLATGVHTIALSKDGHVGETVDVAVARNEPTVVRVELVEESLFQQPWFWGVAGGAALVVAGGTAFAVYQGLSESGADPPRVVLGKPAE